MNLNVDDIDIQKLDISFARKLLVLSEGNLTVDDFDEMQQLLTSIETNFYNKFKLLGGRKYSYSSSWISDDHTIAVRFPTSAEWNSLPDKITVFSAELAKFFKSAKFKTRRLNTNEFLVINPASEIKELRKTRFLEVGCYTSAAEDGIVNVLISIFPFECKENIRMYNSNSQVTLFKLYSQQLLKIYDVSVKALRLVDVDVLK